MSCTIFYKGTLRENTNPSDVLDIVSKHIKNINAELTQSTDPIVVNFLRGQSEPLVFEFKNKKLDSFCKWNGETPEEFYAIFDMFIELKSIFKSLKIEDDEGLWHEYIIQKQPCKIKLRPLSCIEIQFLERMKTNEINTPNEIEKFVMAKSNLTPFYKSLLRVIVQDFIEIMKIGSVDEFKPQAIVDLTNKLGFSTEYGFSKDVENFNFLFHRMLVAIWISCVFEYKEMGVVKELADDTKGLQASKVAALWGIESIFLNRHSGGAANSKEAEMRKLAKRHYKTGALGEVMVIDKPERELEFFFSMMDYLGFIYIGI